jgi:hypothetical protein
VRAQAAVEFSLLITFLFLVFIVLFVVIGQRMIQMNADKTSAEVDQILDTMVEEVKLAQGVENGYKRPFQLHKELSGRPYTLNISDNSILELDMEGISYYRILPTFVMGGFCFNATTDKGDFYNLSVTRDYDIISLSSCYNCTYSYAQCANADNMTLCDAMEGFFPGFKKICCDGHCKCCP